MKDSPPQPLVDLLSGLGLAGLDEVCAVTGRVRRLAGGLPLFESLWLDALAQARVITTWQAVEIDGGRGPALKVGPFLLYERLMTLGYVNVYRARELEGAGFVRLSIAADGIDRLDAQRRLSSLVLKSDELTTPLSPVVRHGLDGERLWAASAWMTGRTARQWMLGHGRFPPAMVREIARQMLQGLVACERAGFVHADLGLDQLWFDGRGEVRMPDPGLRAALRPQESGQLELPAEAYDYLSPERAASGTICGTRDDVWACGTLWWHMLTGRPPFAGATAAAKLHTLRTAKLPDIRQVVPETPGPFAELLMRCLSRAPSERPESLAAVAAALGEPEPRTGRRLAKSLRPHARRRRWSAARVWRPGPRRTWVAGAVGIALAVVILAWPGIAPRLDEQPREVSPTIAAAKRPALPAKPTHQQSAMAERRSAPRPTRNRTTVAAVPTLPADDAAYQPSTGAQFDVPRETMDDLPLPDSLATPDEQSPVLHVSADGPVIDLAQVQPGQTLRGDPDRRPAIDVPPGGLELTASGVTLEHIDFVARQPFEAGAAMLTLRGLKTTLRGCSFQAASDLSPGEAPAAIHWDRGLDPDEANIDLSTGELVLRDVALRRVAVGVTCRLSAGMVLRFENVLCLESGPAVAFDRFPAADEVAMLSLSRTTLRQARSLVQVGCDEIPDSFGRLEIEAADCAFVLPAAGALVLFQGAERPGPLLPGVRFSGQGCVLSPRSRLAIWRTPKGRMMAAKDDAVPMEGVVRGEVGFAGSPDDAAAGSRIIRWQAPLISARPPGIDDAALSLPR